MRKDKNKLILQIQSKAAKKAGQFARQLINAPAEEKEEILAGLEFERWLANTCIVSLDCPE